MEEATISSDRASESGWDERVRIPGSAERDRFVLAHAPLVRYVAQRILARVPSSVDLDDLINDGLVGLIEAIDRFDPTRSVRFRSFAESRVRGAMLDSLRARDMASRTLRRKLRALDAATLRVEQRLGRPPRAEEVAQELGVSAIEVANLRRDREAARTAEIEPRFGGDADDDGLRCPAPGPFEQVSEAEMLDRLAGLVEDLSPRERLILGLYYEEGLTLKEIGEVLCVTESRVCQIHTRALRELRARLGDRAPAAAPAPARRRG